MRAPPPFSTTLLLVRTAACITGMLGLPAAHAAEGLREAAPVPRATLASLYAQARQHDSQLLASQAQLDAAQAREDQAEATFWPQLGLTANTIWNRQQIRYERLSISDRHDEFNTHGYTFQLTQPLLRWANHAQWREASSLTRQSAAQVKQTEMEMLVRLAQAYYEACQFKEGELASQAQVTQAESELATLLKRVDKGAAPAHEAMRARARLGIAQAQWQEAMQDHALRLAVLSESVGYGVAPGSLACEAPQRIPTDDRLDNWLTMAQAKAPNILAQQAAVDAAKAAISRARGAHLPTLDLVATAGSSRQGPTSSLATSTKGETQTIGVQLSIPLYAGGGLDAKTREALALLSKAEQDLESARAQVRVQVRQAWGMALTSQAYVDAAQLTVQARQERARTMAKEGQLGNKTEFEVLTAWQDLASARKDLAQVMGQAVQAQVKLRTLAGNPDLLEPALAPRAPEGMAGVQAQASPNEQAQPN